MTESMALTGGQGEVRDIRDDRAPEERVTHWSLEIKRDEEGIPSVVELRLLTKVDGKAETDREIILR